MLSIARNRLPAHTIQSPLFRWLIIVALVLATAPASAAPHQNPLLDKPAPAFARASLGHQPIDLAALRGRVVLLNFWATWCAGCKIEMPRFVQWQDKYAAQGLSIVGVSMDDDSAPVQSYLRKHPLNYPIVMGDEKLGLAYGGVLGLPVTYLIDRSGIVRACYQGGGNLDGMETAIRKLLHTR